MGDLRYLFLSIHCTFISLLLPRFDVNYLEQIWHTWEGFSHNLHNGHFWQFLKNTFSLNFDPNCNIIFLRLMKLEYLKKTFNIQDNHWISHFKDWNKIVECKIKINGTILIQKWLEMDIVHRTKYDRCTIEPLAKATGFLKIFAAYLRN